MNNQRHTEAGMALFMSIMMMIIITIVVALIVFQSTSQTGASQRNGARTSSLDAAGAGVQALQQALVAGRNADIASAVQPDGYSVTPAVMTTAAALVGGTLVPTSTQPFWDVDTGLGGVNRTIQGPLQGDNERQMWQVVQALPPTGAQPWLTLYVRGWRTNGTTHTDAAVIKVRLKPGSMADYQLLSDMPINISPGAAINGRIHSNGSEDEWTQAPASNPGLRIWSRTPVTCSPTSGVTPIVSTARGGIGIGTGTNCDIREATGDYVSLDSARDAVVRMRARNRANPSGDVAVVEGADTSITPAILTIYPTSVVATYPGEPNQSINTPAGQTRAIVVDRDVVVRQATAAGATQARLTIAAWGRGIAGRAAPTITLVSSVGRQQPTNTLPRALGLLAEGDVIIDPTSNVSYPSVVQAAILSATGGVRLPWRYRTPTRVTTAGFYPSARPSISVTGSIASHASIALRWSWGSSWIGYGQRTYSWDAWLATYPPPYWPTSNPWEIIDQSEANADCYGARKRAGWAGSPRCR